MTRALQTPYYLIDAARLRANMEAVSKLRALSGAKTLLALKCFSTWPVFDLMADAMDGITSSSLYELRLGAEKFGGECHAYSVAWGDHEIEQAVALSQKIIFNSLSQLQRFEAASAGTPRGLRLNPGFSTSDFDLADPARAHSRLGERALSKLEEALPLISGVMIHNNCENDDFARFSAQLERIEAEYGAFLKQLDWVSLGGGIHFTAPDYPLEALAARLKTFSETFGVQVYLEPGEAAITNCATLETSVLDIIENDKKIAIVDASIEAHMLDLLIYRETAHLPQDGQHRYQIAGKTCLAGDIFGEGGFHAPLTVGDRISIADAAGYTMVKKNWFNGLNMPSIAIKDVDGTTRLVREFGYDDFVSALG